MHLSERTTTKQRFHAHYPTTLISLSTLTRVFLFAFAGVYTDASLLWLAMFLAPGMLIGVTIGRRITLSMSMEQFLS